MKLDTVNNELPQRPISAEERVIALDALRGFALLGILVMNIQAFSMPEAAYFVPTLYGDLDGINLWVWIVSHVLMDQKFMALFSILFGAGIVLQTANADTRGMKVTGFYYRRTFWLLVFGLLHAYLFWAGDILTTYAICAALVFWLRKLSPRSLLIIGICVLLVSPILTVGSYQSLQFAPAEVVQNLVLEFSPSQEVLQGEVAAYRGGWLAQMAARVPSAVSTHTSGMLFYLLWRASGLMLVGMALYKWRVLSATRTPGFYNRLMWIGFGVGIPVVAIGVYINFSNNWDVLYSRLGPGTLYNYFGSVFMAFGYLGAVMRIVQLGVFKPLQNRLAAVGRMALTNYLFHTLLATLLFYGYGFGLFGSVPRWGQVLVVLMIWGVQLIISPLWLRYFRFGPFEWLWRSLSYKRIQPMTKA